MARKRYGDVKISNKKDKETRGIISVHKVHIQGETIRKIYSDSNGQPSFTYIYVDVPLRNRASYEPIRPSAGPNGRTQLFLVKINCNLTKLNSYFFSWGTVDW